MVSAMPCCEGGRRGGGGRVRAHELLAKELLKGLNCHLHIAFGAAHASLSLHNNFQGVIITPLVGLI